MATDADIATLVARIAKNATNASTYNAAVATAISSDAVSLAAALTAPPAVTPSPAPAPTPAPATALGVTWPKTIAPVVSGSITVVLALAGPVANCEIWYNGKAITTPVISADHTTATATIDTTKLPDGSDVELDAWVWNVSAGVQGGKDAMTPITLVVQNGAASAPTPSPAPSSVPITVVGSADTTDLTKWMPTFDSKGFKDASGKLDTSVWRNTFYFGDRVLNSNGERQYYMNDGYTGDGGYTAPDGSHNLGINPFSFNADGSLRITADVSDPAKSAYYWGYPYTSGLITTEDSFSQTYGRFLMRAKLPNGKGLWPAFWLLPVDKSWPPEIDTLEAFGATNANGEGGSTKIHVGNIASNSAQSGGEWVDVGIDVTAGFHEYATEWDASQITYFFDGKQVFQKATPDDCHKAMYMLANLAVGGTWPGLPDSTNVWPAFMDVAYVRAYAKR